MKIEQRDGSLERRILTAMIVDSSVLAKISNKWSNKTPLFKSKWSNLIASWCVDFFLQYDKPPCKSIEGIYEAWSEKTKDKETSELVGRFLDGLSGEYVKLKKDVNSEYIIDIASKHFNHVRLRQLAEKIQGDLDSGDLDRATLRANSYNQIEMGLGSVIDVLSDQEAIRRAFEGKQAPLIEYPHALKAFFGDSLERDGLIAFQAPEKRAKTFWQIDLAWRGMQQRRKVAFFEVGDLSEHQIMLRFMIRAAKRPLKACEIKVPKLIEHNPGDLFATVDFEERVFTKPLSWSDAWKACESILKKTKSNDSLLKLSVHPNNSISIHGIRDEVDSMARHGWSPDIIVIDYADLIAPISGAADSRDAINSTWKGLRALSQSMHCLVVTATQANAASYKAYIMSRSNFSEDKRKYAHVTGMIGINCTDEEKALGLSRLNWLELRERDYTESKCVHVAGCLALANPAMRSIW